MLHEDLKRASSSLPKVGHPMAVCAAAVGGAVDLLPEGRAEHARAELDRSIRLLAKMPTIAAYSYKHSIGQPFMYPRNDLSYAATSCA
jgi:citrate synthase